MDSTSPKNSTDTIEGFEWQAPEYFHREKDSDWFWGLGIVTLTLMILSILFSNIIFAVFLAVAACTLALFAHRPPKLVNVRIHHRALELENNRYYYSELESFWLREFDLHPKILVKSKKMLMPYIIIPLPEFEDIHPEDIRNYLLSFLKEEHQEEPLLQRLMEYLGF